MALRFQQKLIIPTSSRPLVVRAQLLTQIEQAITTKRVVALAAPAGWGKTMVLAQWAQSSRLPVTWYTLDAADRDPQLFLDYLLHTVAERVPGATPILGQLAGAAPQNLPDLIHATALAIAATPEPFALVFDDFQVLEDEAPAALPGTSLVLDLLASIAEYATNCHLVFASRTLPAIHGLVRMVAQQRAAVFDYTALQFSASDIQQLAGTCYAITLSARSADQLMTQLGGWITGIVLSLDQAMIGGQCPREQHLGVPSCESLRDALLGPRSSVPVEADTSQVYAFFAEQIIAPLAPDLQRFLEETSVLQDLSPQRCDRLRGSNDSALFLDEVKRHGLFVSSRAGWLAYHSLFRDFLRMRLARTPLRQRDLLRHAGDLYRDEEDLEQALNCYLAVNDEDAAIALLRDTIPRFRRRSRQTTLLACFELLGQNHLLPPDLLLDQARVYSDLALWEHASLAIQLVGTIGDEVARWEADILHADLLLLQGDHVRAQAALADTPVEVLPPRLQFAYLITAGRSQILGGDIPAAITSLEQAHALTASIAESSDDPSALANVYDNLGWAYATQGDRQAALRHLRRADAYWQASGNSGRRALTLNNLGIMTMEEGRYAEARTAFTSGLALAEQTGRRREEIVLRCSMAELEIIDGDLEQAIARLTEAHALAVQMDIPNGVETAAASALWAAALQGDLALGQAWLDVCAPFATSSQAEVRGRLALGQSLLMLLRPHPDLALLDQLSAEATAVDASLSTAERAYAALLRAALIFERKGWPAAVEAWEAFALRAANLPDSLLVRFGPAHQRIFAAARHSSPLARRFTDAIERPCPSRWQVIALGAFSCLLDGTSCDLSPLHRVLLVRLLDAGPQGLTVERLWESVWGENDISMPALHQALRRLRVQTGLAVAAREGYCAIRSPWEAIEYDVHMLEHALETSLSHETIQRAMALYRGDFLPSAPLSAALWVDTRRALLQQRYLDALEQFAYLSERDAPNLAIYYYQQVLLIDGCREQTAARLMKLAASFGNRSLVNTTFEHLKGALRGLGLAPEPTTAALYQQLL